MTISRSEDMLVGLIALALVPWIGWVLSRSRRDGRLPIGRAYVLRAVRPGAFNVLTGLYAAAAVAAFVISLDLLLGLGGRT